MLGKTVLFLPGFDHAGIATQSVVEKQLFKQEGKTRYDYGREQFIEKVWDWKNVYHKRIKDQIKKMGGSYDWSREVFTLDPKLSNAVTEAFVRLHDEGIIYRDSKLINWCTKLNTAISNLEVENKEISGKISLNVPGYDKPIEFGVLTSIAYEVVNESDLERPDEKIIVSTTRPETIFGDTAIAIHPDDTRYKHLHGKFVKHPLLEKKIPIVLDSKVVDMEFGTGAVKITPAHDINDYQCGKRNNLPFINIFTDDGLLNENCGSEWEGMKRFDARKAVIDKLKEKNLFVGEEEHSMTIPICSRSGDVIEPLLKPQWWISQDFMSKEALRVVEEGQITIRPTHSKEEYFRWLRKIDDWCISRQLWWGHRCPVYFVKIKGSNDALMRSNNKYWVAARNIEEARIKASIRFPDTEFSLEQDTDVLDTWFSSALWPFSTLGWPNKSKEMQIFYPFSMLETGWDILFFWVARMIIMGVKLTGSVPFKEVFCHPLVRDAQGRKMSKSLGNVIDPVDVINGASLKSLQDKLASGNLDRREIKIATKGLKRSYPNGIPQCGTDALRFALCSYTSNDNANDINLDIKKVETYRKFCNKLYQATNFALMNLGEESYKCGTPETNAIEEQFILNRMNQTCQKIATSFESRHFMNVTDAIYQFWYEICDHYIEYFKFVSKNGKPEEVKSAQGVLVNVLDNGLRMIHPMMPFISEELWQKLPLKKPTESICVAPYPQYDEAIAAQYQKGSNTFEQILELVSESRGILNQYNILKNGKLFVEIKGSELKDIVEHKSQYVKDSIKLNIESLEFVTRSDELPEGCVSKSVNRSIVVHLLVKGQIADVEGDIKKLDRKINKLRQKYQNIRNIMNNENYSKANESVRSSNDLAIKDLTIQIETFEMTVNNLRKSM
ncbi:valine--tRNA ligase [Maudiozyma exigua]|uniref:Valine--tRNA ligase, mitochondrial n=1 Tax=Maudiozyma exigua TaxID=34358 RepID=A0A9P7BAV0_MAUEX|nr:valine--tRNA ligase [Kazachstania exigua]